MGAVFAFAAALVALRLGGRLAARWRARRAPELLAWAAALFAYAAAAASLAWGASAGWDTAATTYSTTVRAKRSEPSCLTA